MEEGMCWVMGQSLAVFMKYRCDGGGGRRMENRGYIEQMMNAWGSTSKKSTKGKKEPTTRIIPSNTAGWKKKLIPQVERIFVFTKTYIHTQYTRLRNVLFFVCIFSLV